MLGCNCSWNIKYELAIEGWVLVSYQPRHVSRASDATAKPHDLEQSASAAMAVGSMREGVPDELTSLGELLAKSGVAPAEILNVLEIECKNLGIRSNFNYKDIYDRFPTNLSKRGFDATGLVEHLQKRKDERGMACYVRTSASGCVSKVFFQLDNSLAEWAKAPNCNVLLFDPTHGTNKYKMKLCCFTTISPTGQTVILACALITYEDTSHIEWAFRCFASTFKTPPVALFTDSASSIEAAFQLVSSKSGEIWESVRHFYCIFHLSKNFWEHIHPLFATKKDKWHKINSLFWDIAKNSDATFRGPTEPGQETWSQKLHPENEDFVDIMNHLQREDDSLS